ncbi:MAG: hypothetical protein JW841_05110 [Deltaproteobacteria bacterium]|nr:hypothetical protein [Deltaproteobacteria bacterium]
MGDNTIGGNISKVKMANGPSGIKFSIGEKYEFAIGLKRSTSLGELKSSFQKAGLNFDNKNKADGNIADDVYATKIVSSITYKSMPKLSETHSYKINIGYDETTDKYYYNGGTANKNREVTISSQQFRENPRIVIAFECEEAPIWGIRPIARSESDDSPIAKRCLIFEVIEGGIEIVYGDKTKSGAMYSGNQLHNNLISDLVFTIDLLSHMIEQEKAKTDKSNEYINQLKTLKEIAISKLKYWKPNEDNIKTFVEEWYVCFNYFNRKLGQLEIEKEKLNKDMKKIVEKEKLNECEKKLEVLEKQERKIFLDYSIDVSELVKKYAQICNITVGIPIKKK